MRKLIKDFVKIIAEHIPVGEPIYEFGSLQVPEQENFGDLRPFFPGKQYWGADMRPGPGVDKILNLHDIELPSEHVGTVLCLDTLEHVEYPHRALEEIHRILKPDGIAVISSVMNFHIHDYPHDYWRFTPEAFKSLLKPYSGSFIGFVGMKDFPHTVVGIGFKEKSFPLSQFEADFKKWKASQEVRAGLSTLEWIRKLITPPILSKKGRKALDLFQNDSR
jgi:SAM-dependent methyltransferase